MIVINYPTTLSFHSNFSSNMFHYHPHYLTPLLKCESLIHPLLHIAIQEDSDLELLQMSFILNPLLLTLILSLTIHINFLFFETILFLFLELCISVPINHISVISHTIPTAYDLHTIYCVESHTISGSRSTRCSTLFLNNAVTPT